MDDKPTSWEDRIILFTGYLVDSKLKSTTIRTYISAVRGALAEDGFELDSNIFAVSALTRACRIRNDTIIHQFPIHKGVLRLILSQADVWADEICQPYLRVLYKALFATTYYGLLRVGEVTLSPHVVLARDVHIGINKKKLLLVLRSSKTHNKGQHPQLIKIISTPTGSTNSATEAKTANQCPFALMEAYLSMRPHSKSLDEQFFVFSDGSPVKPTEMRHTLRVLLKRSGLDESNYTVHGPRSGRCRDLLKLGLSIETIKKFGRWKSNAVFTYFKS